MRPQLLETQTKAPAVPALVSVDGRSYRLRSAELRAAAEGGLAFTTLVQEFENPYDEPLEVHYTMPLPADGAVLGYLIGMGERVIRGEIETRENAADAYKHALFEGRTVGLLEQDRADTFQQRLGNLPARTSARIEIEVLHPLGFLSGVDDRGPAWEYRFPTVVGVRYEGAPGRVIDAERLDANRARADEIPTRVAIDLQIADVADTTAITSPSHTLRPVPGAERVHVHLADAARLDRDLVIQWPAGTNDVGVRVVEGDGLKGDTGRYALLTVTPPAVPAVVFRRDVTVLIDSSGSMSGAPLDTAKRVVADLLQSLVEGDRFELLAFASDVSRFSPKPTPATPQAIRDCLRWLDHLEANGGTEMHVALGEAMHSMRGDSQRQVVLVSDGYIGFEDEIVRRVAADLPAGVRVHMVGVGAAPNRTLSSCVARAGRGMELFAQDEASAVAASSRLRAATAAPVLTEISIGGTAIIAHAPARPRDVFAGQPLVLAVELRADGGTLELGGFHAGSREAWTWQMELLPLTAVKSLIPLGALYGRERIADLEAGVVGESRNHDERIERLGLRHRIVSRRTSLIAIADEPATDPRAPRRRERLAVEMPYGVSAEGVGLGVSLTLFQGVPSRPMVGAFRRVAPYGATVASLARVKALGVTPPTIVDAVSVVWLDATTVIIEFTTPHDGFMLPIKDVNVEGPRGAICAIVDGDASSPTGPHAKGLILRIALRIEGKLASSGPAEFVMRWTAISRTFLLRSRKSSYAMTFMAPPPRGRDTGTRV